MTPPIAADQVQVREWRRLFVWYLWLSVAACAFAAILVSQVGGGENARLLAAGLFGLGMLGAAYARAVRNLDRPRWWHWALGALLITPAVLVVASLGVGE
jgi:ABC-type phosphate/phosphonate transport system permease subunit